jgi:hypothetical protein
MADAIDKGRTYGNTLSACHRLAQDMRARKTADSGKENSEHWHP